ncbi:MAG TPA: maleylpyruvate isomerase N-terminal domain-containing protein [Terriglobales bacterium]|nr:maleylpyruvate isomerase N-terminal domain-containing protein [Terriglobales bacterium]
MPHEGGAAERVLRRLDAGWAAFGESYAGLPDALLLVPGVVGDWSVKDVLAHVSAWEEEAIAHLPVIAAGGRPPRYAASGGIDAFNARTAERRRDLSLGDVRRLLEESHRRLVELVRNAPDDQLAGDTRFRRRLRLDTYGHYRLHSEGIRSWRSIQGLQ